MRSMFRLILAIMLISIFSIPVIAETITITQIDGGPITLDTSNSYDHSGARRFYSETSSHNGRKFVSVHSRLWGSQTTTTFSCLEAVLNSCNHTQSGCLKVTALIDVTPLPYYFYVTTRHQFNLPTPTVRRWTSLTGAHSTNFYFTGAGQQNVVQNYPACMV